MRAPRTEFPEDSVSHVLQYTWSSGKIYLREKEGEEDTIADRNLHGSPRNRSHEKKGPCRNPGATNL